MSNPIKRPVGATASGSGRPAIAPQASPEPLATSRGIGYTLPANRLHHTVPSRKRLRI